MRTSQTVAAVASLLVSACGAVKDQAPEPDAGSGMPLRPAACADLGSSAANQNVTLYFDGDETKPYQAHCSAGLKTYIPLDGTNTSSYPLGGCAAAIGNATVGVITTWQQIELDPVTHLVDTGDFTYATSTGMTHESSDSGMRVHDYATIPFGSGRSCVSGTGQVVAAIDLTGTHFAIASAQMWASDGFTATTDAAINPQRTKATITATGFPIGSSPCAPNSDYYTEHGGSCLKLDYVP